MKFKCLNCGSIITGDGKGNIIECECKDVYIDETSYYSRVGAKDLNMVLDVEKGKTITQLMKEDHIETMSESEPKKYSDEKSYYAGVEDTKFLIKNALVDLLSNELQNYVDNKIDIKKILDFIDKV